MIANIRNTILANKPHHSSDYFCHWFVQIVNICNGTVGNIDESYMGPIVYTCVCLYCIFYIFPNSFSNQQLTSFISEDKKFWIQILPPILYLKSLSQTKKKEALPPDTR